MFDSVEATNNTTTVMNFMAYEAYGNTGCGVFK